MVGLALKLLTLEEIWAACAPNEFEARMAVGVTL